MYVGVCACVCGCGCKWGLKVKASTWWKHTNTGRWSKADNRIIQRTTVWLLKTKLRWASLTFNMFWVYCQNTPKKLLLGQELPTWRWKHEELLKTELKSFYSLWKQRQEGLYFCLLNSLSPLVLARKLLWEDFSVSLLKPANNVTPLTSCRWSVGYKIHQWCVHFILMLT